LIPRLGINGYLALIEFIFLSLENKMEDEELDELLKDLHAKKTFQ